MRSRKGFTLIEVMVTVGIILIISAAMTLSVSSYLDRANQSADVVSIHDGKYSAALSQISALKTGISTSSTSSTSSASSASSTSSASSVVTSTPTPVPTATPVPTTAATPVPTTAATPVPTATPTPKPTATPTPKPTATPTPTPTTAPVSAYPGTTSTVTAITWKTGFNYRYEFTIPSSSSSQTAVISFPAGVTIELGWTVSGYKILANGARTELYVPAWQTGGAVYVNYTGTEVFNPQVINIK